MRPPDHDKETVREHLRDTGIVMLPRFQEEGQPELSTNQKVELLTDHALLCARWRAVLELDRLVVEDDLHDWRQEWEEMPGWETLLVKRGREVTQNDIRTAKRKTNPDLYRAIADAQHLARQLETAVRRLEKDEERGSRLYTFLTGG